MRPLCFLLGTALVLFGCGREPAPDPEPPAPGMTATVDSVLADSAMVADSVDAAPVNPFAEPARRALRIELGLDDYRAIAGSWAAGDATSSFMAYFDGDSLRLIEEELDFGEYGAAHATYYFDGGLFYVVEDERRTRLDPDAPGIDSLQTRVAFGSNGSVEQSEQIANGEAAPLPVTEAEGFLRHAAELREQLRIATMPPS
jgi:hypothetical protein